MKRIAFYGGSFDPIHRGHLTIAEKLTELFELDEFVFIPAFHAPHKKRKKPTSAFHRYAMLALATNSNPKIKISTIELDAPERPFTVETQTRILNELPDTEIFFVIGADSWLEINTWRDWESVLTLTNIIVVTRPNYEIDFSHVTDEIRGKIIDLRSIKARNTKSKEQNIYITDAVQIDISATEIRRKIRGNENDWHKSVTKTVAEYIEKYELYEMTAS
jgi:nicotinate-nucleotide adenylyltransferase